MRQHPAWYGAVMATGALALAVRFQSITWQLPWLTGIAFALLLFTTLLALVLLPRYRTKLRQNLHHPGNGAMLATLPAGLLILATAWGRIGPAYLSESVALAIDAVLLIIGILTALVMGIAWSRAMMTGGHSLEDVHGGWLIPAVMNLIVPAAIAPLTQGRQGVELIGLAFYGAGIVLFLAMFALLVVRLVLKGPVPPTQASSMFIPLAPAGMSGVSLLALLPSTGAIAVATMGVGFGLWWALLALATLQQYRAQGPLPLHPGWWGFVFPVGAMTLSISAIGIATSLVAVQILGAIATAGLALLWGYVAVRTAGMAFASSPQPSPASPT